ncbi:MAG: DJ-1/PfpI family protein [Alphaproteobacteria bacterium]
MEQKPFLGQKIAILVANGFSESDLIETQKKIQALGGTPRVVSMDQGLVNSWNGSGWGLNFAADQALNSALAADFDGLVVPGGVKSAEKLKLTAHTRRFLNGFLATGKAVFVLNDAIELLSFTETLDGRKIADEGVVVDGNLMTCVGDVDAAVLTQFEAFALGLLSDEQAVAA